MRSRTGHTAGAGWYLELRRSVRGARRRACSRPESGGKATWLPLIRVLCPGSVSRQRLDQTSLGCRQQLRENLGIATASGADVQSCVHINADDVAARREPKLPLAGDQSVPGLMLLSADQGVIAVGAEAPVGSKLASRAGEIVLSASSTVLGPSAWLEVPAAESPNNDMDASR
jgi:hypothetical protein